VSVDLVREVAATFRSRRFMYVAEDRLQQGLAAALVADGFEVEREVRLDAHSRIDLLVNRRVGVEVKVAGSAADVARQCARYLRFESIRGLVLVTSRVRHVQLPADVAGKPLEVVSLVGAGL
jgi:hypothetical protein